MPARFATALLLLFPVLAGCGDRTEAEELAPEPSDPSDSAVDPPAATPPGPTMPESRAGADVVGATLPAGLERGLDPAGTVPRATLYRWWTDKCPFCVASLPAIEELRLAFADRGLETIAVFHPKPPVEPGRISLEAAVEVAKARGYRGRVALDLDWSLLRELWLDAGTRNATSASFLADEHGVVRFVHPGPEFHRSAEPGHALCDSDFRSLERAIEALLAE